MSDDALFYAFVFEFPDLLVGFQRLGVLHFDFTGVAYNYGEASIGKLTPDQLGKVQEMLRALGICNTSPSSGW